MTYSNLNICSLSHVLIRIKVSQWQHGYSQFADNNSETSDHLVYYIDYFIAVLSVYFILWLWPAQSAIALATGWLVSLDSISTVIIYTSRNGVSKDLNSVGLPYYYFIISTLISVLRLRTVLLAEKQALWNNGWTLTLTLRWSQI